MIYLFHQHDKWLILAYNILLNDVSTKRCQSSAVYVLYFESVILITLCGIKALSAAKDDLSVGNNMNSISTNKLLKKTILYFHANGLQQRSFHCGQHWLFSLRFLCHFYTEVGTQSTQVINHSFNWYTTCHLLTYAYKKNYYVWRFENFVLPICIYIVLILLFSVLVAQLDHWWSRLVWRIIPRLELKEFP